MSLYLILAYLFIFLIIAIVLLEEVPMLIYQRWNKFNEERAKKAISKFESIVIFGDKKKITFMFVAIPPILGVVAYLISNKWIFGLAGFIFGLFVPFYYIKQIEFMRKAKFHNQLIDGLMIISNSLKAGLSILQAMEVLMEEMPSPIRDEFSLVVREIKMGISLEEAIGHLNKRMPSEEMNLITSAVLVAKETGGDLIKVFARLISTIRDRYKLKEMITTLTLQGKIQGLVMSFIPIGFFMFVSKNNPDHFKIMLENDLGRLLIAVAIVLQILSFFLIKKFSVIKV